MELHEITRETFDSNIELPAGSIRLEYCPGEPVRLKVWDSPFWNTVTQYLYIHCVDGSIIFEDNNGETYSLSETGDMFALFHAGDFVENLPVAQPWDRDIF